MLGPGEALVALFDCIEGVQFWVKDRAGRYRAMNRACLLDYSLASLPTPREKPIPTSRPRTLPHNFNSMTSGCFRASPL